MSFFDNFDFARARELSLRSESAGRAEVESALASRNLSFSGFLALISPAGGAYLEELAQRARRVTRERFGRVVRLYAPIYLSNECTNSCLYCGFARQNEVRRVTLTGEEAQKEGEFLWDEGFRDILLVSGESPKAVPPEALARTSRLLAPRFPSISVEVYPMETEEYGLLGSSGVEGVTVYQETYDPEIYARVHPRGRKADYKRRISTPDRVGEARLRKVGIGALLGLGPWRVEAISLALHALWLEKAHWRTQVSISFPRIRSAAGHFNPPSPISDRELAQMALALRLLLPDVGLTLSTRETAKFRDGLAPLCFTAISAGSRTEPGGYSKPGEAEEQFAVEDKRTPAEVSRMLLEAGLEPVFKDFDQTLITGGEDASNLTVGAFQ
ncbi:2-iminoacetate synthase ThiH [bacterium]|nr:MAG: 2-iminoacetate synthase ThiH [bacterium]